MHVELSQAQLDIINAALINEAIATKKRAERMTDTYPHYRKSVTQERYLAIMATWHHLFSRPL